MIIPKVGMPGGTGVFLRMETAEKPRFEVSYDFQLVCVNSEGLDTHMRGQTGTWGHMCASIACWTQPEPTENFGAWTVPRKFPGINGPGGGRGAAPPGISSLQSGKGPLPVVAGWVHRPVRGSRVDESCGHAPREACPLGDPLLGPQRGVRTLF